MVKVKGRGSREAPHGPGGGPAGEASPRRGAAPAYDSLGTTYGRHRRTDPRLAVAIHRALGDARRVVNVGAGTGSYEPADREVVAVEPSPVMIAQRPAGAAPVVRGWAEALPFPADHFDAAMAVLSDHHWDDRAAGLRELRRVSRGPVVVVTTDPAATLRFWLTRRYLTAFATLVPAALREPGAWARRFAEALGPCAVTPLPVPHDCADGFLQAFWRRPAAYLDPGVRDGISVFRRLPAAHVERAVAALADDLRTGAWRREHARLLEADELDVGLRLVVAGAGGGGR